LLTQNNCTLRYTIFKLYRQRRSNETRHTRLNEQVAISALLMMKSTTHTTIELLDINYEGIK